MAESGRQLKDVVCAMMVDENENPLIHRGVRYAFCSQQCRERFLARPNLYIGARPGSMPGKAAAATIRRRRVLFGTPLTRAQFGELRDGLQAMMGVRDVRIATDAVGGASAMAAGEPRADGGIDVIEVTYDLLQVTFDQLARKISERGLGTDAGAAEKLRRDFVRYLEECDLDDLEIGDAVREI